MTDNSVPTFLTAAAAWFEDHKRYIKPNTPGSYADALGHLNRSFGDKPINEIEIIHLRMYQDLWGAKISRIQWRWGRTGEPLPRGAVAEGRRDIGSSMGLELVTAGFFAQ
jgi:hypothetical protein